MVRLRKPSKTMLLNNQQHANNWSYWSTTNGPNEWKYIYSQARGDKQSPVLITRAKSIYDPLLGQSKFRFDYKQEDLCKLANDGNGWSVNFGNDSQSILSSSCLNGTYKLYQIRCHWGDIGENGSEHKLCEFNDSGEIHIVHFSSKYCTYEEAIKYKDGVAILSVLLEESGEDNPIFTPITQLLNVIRYKNSSISLPKGYDAMKLIPERRDFWTYEGSLTAPPCNECVIWMIFRDTLNVSNRQLNAFRSLFAVTREEKENVKICQQIISNNLRPVQPLNGRIVRCSFRSGAFSSNYFWD